MNDPRRGLSRCSGSVPAGAGVARRRGRAERLSAGEYRLAGDDADVRDADGRSDVRGGLLGLRGSEIPFTVLSVALYVYLFSTVPGSLSLELGFVSEHPMLTAVLVLGAALRLVLVGRFFWRRVTKLRERAQAQRSDSRPAVPVRDRAGAPRARQRSCAAGDRRRVPRGVLDSGELVYATRRAPRPRLSITTHSAGIRAPPRR